MGMIPPVYTMRQPSIHGPETNHQLQRLLYHTKHSKQLASMFTSRQRMARLQNATRRCSRALARGFWCLSLDCEIDSISNVSWTGSDSICYQSIQRDVPNFRIPHSTLLVVSRLHTRSVQPHIPPRWTWEGSPPADWFIHYTQPPSIILSSNRKAKLEVSGSHLPWSHGTWRNVRCRWEQHNPRMLYHSAAGKVRATCFLGY